MIATFPVMAVMGVSSSDVAGGGHGSAMGRSQVSRRSVRRPRRRGYSRRDSCQGILRSSTVLSKLYCFIV